MPKYINANELLKNRSELRGILICRDETQIINFPAADVAPVVYGRWLTIRWSNASCCSNCGIEFNFGGDEEFIYCPNCGAKMDGDKNE